MWWWIEPLFKTGLICILIDAIFTAIFSKVKSNVIDCIVIILILPFGISVCASIIWVLTEIFEKIWCPYL